LSSPPLSPATLKGEGRKREKNKRDCIGQFSKSKKKDEDPHPSLGGAEGGGDWRIYKHRWHIPLAPP